MWSQVKRGVLVLMVEKSESCCLQSRQGDDAGWYPAGSEYPGDIAESKYLLDRELRMLR
jgi:hypothetical protein